MRDVVFCSGVMCSSFPDVFYCFPFCLLFGTVIGSWFRVIHSVLILFLLNKGGQTKNNMSWGLWGPIKMLEYWRALTHACFPLAQSHESAEYTTVQLSFNMLLISIMKHPEVISLSSLLLQKKNTSQLQFGRFFLSGFKSSHSCFSCQRRAWWPYGALDPLRVHWHRFLQLWKVSADSCFCLDNSSRLGFPLPSLHPSHFLFTSAGPSLPAVCRKPVIREKWQRRKSEESKTLVYSGQSWQGSLGSCTD